MNVAINIFLDANVIIDFISHREPHYSDSLPLWQLIDSGSITAYTSALSILVAHYVLRKSLSEAVT